MNQLLYTYCYIIVELVNYLLTYLVIFHAKVKERKSWIICLLPIFFITYIVIQLQSYEVAWRVIEMSGISIPLFALQGKKQKWILLYPAVMMISSMISVCVSFICSIVTEVPDLSFVSDMGNTLICELSSMAIMIGIGLYERWKKREFVELQFHVKQYLVLYIEIICGIILIGCAQLLTVSNHLSDKDRNMFGLAIAAICLLLMFMGIWNSIIVYNQEQYRYQVERLKDHLEMQENQIKIVIQSDEKLRAYRHDMKAHLLALQALYEQEDTSNDMFGQYVDEIIQTSEIFHSISYTGNTAVDAVLNKLNETALASNIHISFECTVMEKLPVSLFGLCTILSNLIQNAIEACEKNQKQKEISVIMYPFSCQLYIAVKNPVDECVQIDGRRLLTSKKDKVNHGIGSQNVRSIVEKYNGELNYVCEDGCFTAEVLV